MTRKHWALALSLAAPAALVVASAPVAAQPGTGVNGWNVQVVQFGGGTYAKQGDGSWAEYNSAGQIAFRFVETQRDEWSVYLNDPSRNVQIQLDLFRRKISYGTGGGQRSDLYDITGAAPRAMPQRVTPPPPPPPPPPPRTRAVNAGPIWNQADAAVKCPVVGYAVNGRWTGGWWTVRNGEMSVCEIAF
jgi:hypothetical protein